MPILLPEDEHCLPDLRLHCIKAAYPALWENTTYWTCTLYLISVAHLELQFFLVSFREDSYLFHFAEAIHTLCLMAIHFKFKLWIDRIWTAGKSKCEKSTQKSQINPHQCWDIFTTRASFHWGSGPSEDKHFSDLDPTYFRMNCSKKIRVQSFGWLTRMDKTLLSK